MKHTSSCRTWKRKTGINWHFVLTSKLFFACMPSDSCHKKMLLESLNVPLSQGDCMITMCDIFRDSNFWSIAWVQFHLSVKNHHFLTIKLLDRILVFLVFWTKTAHCFCVACRREGKTLELLFYCFLLLFVTKGLTFGYILQMLCWTSTKLGL